MQELIGSAPGTVCRERLSRSALRRAWSVGDRTIDVLIGRLRKKLALVTDEVSLITVRGGGYALRPNTAKIAAVHSIGARQPA
jgi:DNA-binding response OmpR family regulator